MKFYLSIRFKLFIAFNILIIFILAIKFILNTQSLKTQHYNNFKSTNKTIYEFLTANMKEYIYQRNIAAQQAMIDSIHNSNIKNIYIFDEDLKVIVQQKKSTPHNIDDFKIFLEKNSDGLVVYKGMRFYLSTFSVLEIPMAYMLISVDLNNLHKNIKSQELDLYVETFIFLFLSIVFVYFISMLITRPIEEIVGTLKGTDKSEILILDKSNQDEFGFLAHAIELTHNDLRILNNSLENEVKSKTEELMVLNEDLEERVKEEVHKNREQEKHMLNQSKLAQMGEMLSMIAHQWRQPLSAISAASSGLLLKTTLNRYKQEDFKQKLSDIIEYTQHLSTTIDDFRDFFKSNKETKEVEVRDLINGVEMIISSALANNNVTLNINYIYDGVIRTYPNEVKQVILNLLKNAEDIHKEKNIQNPTIEIVVEMVGTDCVIKVCDNAGGIDDDIIVKIFDPYFTTKEQSDGTGLGLYMSKTIIEQHCQGKLSVSNKADGAVFTIVLPQNMKTNHSFSV